MRASFFDALNLISILPIYVIWFLVCQNKQYKLSFSIPITKSTLDFFYVDQISTSIQAQKEHMFSEKLIYIITTKWPLKLKKVQKLRTEIPNHNINVIGNCVGTWSTN